MPTPSGAGASAQVPDNFPDVTAISLEDLMNLNVTSVSKRTQKLADAAYDDALRDLDLLAMPTIPMRATRLPAPDATREEKVARALEMIPNTSPFDVTGHPAMNVPCAMSGGLPVGMMLVGRHWEDATVLRAARAFEETGAYSTRPRPAAAQR